MNQTIREAVLSTLNIYGFITHQKHGPQGDAHGRARLNVIKSLVAEGKLIEDSDPRESFWRWKDPHPSPVVRGFLTPIQWQE